MKQLDVDWVRAQFPALATDWVLFEQAGGSVPARHVIERVTDYMSRRMVQLGASYPLSVEATGQVAAGRRAAELLLGADEGEVVLGSSSTALVYTLSRALRAGWRQGDELVVTDLDHEANSGPWRKLAETGIVVREWKCDAESLRLEPEGLVPLLNERTRLVAFTHCSNLVGTLHDVRALVALVRAAGALACVDGVAYAPHRLIDVKALDADFYFASLYKLYGPHLAMLCVRRQLLDGLAGQNHDFIGYAPDKLEPGGVVHELAAALPGITAYLDAFDRHHHDEPLEPARARLARAFDLIARHEMSLAAPLLGFLAERSNVRLLGGAVADAATRAPTISFTVDGMDARNLPPRLEERRIAVRCGDFYARRLVERLGLSERGGVVRVSMVHYNTTSEVERLIEGLDAIL